MTRLTKIGSACLMAFGFANGSLVINVMSNTNNYNVFTAAGSPAVKRDVIVNIMAGVTVGATAGNTALIVGQFPTGSNITINNYGSILAYGGVGGGYYSSGSVGGDAIFANYANQTVIINNFAGSLIYGGGGGGGSGGKGGTGGDGGMGYWVDSSNSPTWDPQYYVDTSHWSGDMFDLYNGIFYVNDWGGTMTTGFYINWGYYGDPLAGWQVGTYQFTWYGDGDDYYAIQQWIADGYWVWGWTDHWSYWNVYTSGGAGGAGGNGSAGGRGQGSDGAATSGVTGAAPSAGSAGGLNAGTGGGGGYGGTGGTGGAYGADGASGTAGGAGSNGTAGNWSGYGGPVAPQSGAGGGAAGRYLVKGANAVTLNNSGTVAGTLA